MKRTNALKEFQRIPGVGPSIAKDLVDLGYSHISELQHAAPEDMYHKLCMLRGITIDKCVLYVFREAVYFASHEQHDPNLLKWWNWKDMSFCFA